MDFYFKLFKFRALLLLLLVLAISKGNCQEEFERVGFTPKESTAFYTKEEGEDKPEVILDLPLYSKYVFRGLNVVDGPVLQPSVTSSYKGWTFQVWGNYNLTNRQPGVEDPIHKFTEIDLNFYYTYTCGRYSLIFGVVDYEFPNTDEHNTVEAYGTLALEIPYLNPRFTVYRDVDQVRGWVEELILSHTFEELWKCGDVSFGIALAASTHFQSERSVFAIYGGFRHAAWTDADFQIAMPIELMKNLVLTPSVRFSSLIDREIRGAFDHPDNTIWGIDLAWEW